MLKTSLAVVAAFALSLSTESRAAELVIFSTGSMSEPMKEIGEAFMHKTGHKLSYVIGTTGALQARLRAGEHADAIAISAEGAASRNVATCVHLPSSPRSQCATSPPSPFRTESNCHRPSSEL